jgi:uncharacterized protein (TIGR04255 family)
MNERPDDLPDYTNPPVTEVVLGVQFNNIEGFKTPHLGLIWDAFRSSFGQIEEHSPVPPIFETFGPNPGVLFGGISLPFGMPRVFFVNDDRTQLLQVQRDRFLHNWRKVVGSENYPRFERMLRTFEEGLCKFKSVVDQERLGQLVPNQCEVTYINQVPFDEDESAFPALRRMLTLLSGAGTLSTLGEPEDARILLRYQIRDDSGRPIGRLITTAEPARRTDGVAIIQFTLTVRGVPPSPDIPGVSNFLKVGRMHIVKGFTELTRQIMHKRWGRVQ